METPITAIDFLEASVHSPLNAPQNVAAIIDMAEAMGQPMTSRRSPSMEPPMPYVTTPETHKIPITMPTP